MTIVGKLGIFFIVVGITKLTVTAVQYFINSRSERNG